MVLSGVQQFTGMPTFTGIRKPQPHKFFLHSQIANLDRSFS